MRPLHGIRVLDFTRILAGPFATMLLSDLGAEIIKIERPNKGDETREYGPPFFENFSTYFLSVNRGKKSLTLDLNHPKSRGIVTSLILASDILVENFRPKTMAKFGLDYPKVSALNPRLVYCSISGYGQNGKVSHLPCYDLVVQGMSGLMDLTGSPESSPFKFGTSIADIVAGLYAVNSILAALLEREKTNQGKHLDIALLDSMVSTLTYQATLYFAGKSPKRMGNQHPSICPYETFQAQDNYLNVACANDELWQKLCQALNHSELPRDPRFRTNPDRVKNRKDLLKILNEIFKTKLAQNWLALFKNHGIPAGPILAVPEILESQELQERKMILKLPVHGKNFRFLENPLSSFRETESIPPPSLGEQTNEILGKLLKLLPAEIEALRRDKVV